jgi:hypothetical protein
MLGLTVSVSAVAVAVADFILELKADHLHTCKKSFSAPSTVSGNFIGATPQESKNLRIEKELETEIEM